MKPSLDPAIQARARSQVYALLSLVYRQELNQDFLTQMRQPELRSVLSECGIEIPDSCGDESGLLEDLAVEYSDLFIVPKRQVSPHESVHNNSGDGTLWGEETVDVKRFIETTGLNLDETSLLPDHVAVEMELLCKLKDKEGEAWDTGNTERALEYMRAQRRFLEEHLGRWFPRLAEKVEKKARLPFYRQMTVFTRNFIESDIKEIDATLNDVNQKVKGEPL